jgi:hypothetical protein
MRALHAFAAAVCAALLGASFAACAHGPKPPPPLYPEIGDPAAVGEHAPRPGTRFGDWPVIDGGEGETTDGGEAPAADPQPGAATDRVLWEGPPPPAAQVPLRTHSTYDDPYDDHDGSGGSDGGGEGAGGAGGGADAETP